MHKKGVLLLVVIFFIAVGFYSIIKSSSIEPIGFIEEPKVNCWQEPTYNAYGTQPWWMDEAEFHSYDFPGLYRCDATVKVGPGGSNFVRWER